MYHVLPCMLCACRNAKKGFSEKKMCKRPHQQPRPRVGTTDKALAQSIKNASIEKSHGVQLNLSHESRQIQETFMILL